MNTQYHLLSLSILALTFAPFRATAQERPDNYPFDVTVAGQAVVYDERFPSFAKVPEPVAADAEVILKAKPEAVIVNIAPVNSRGIPTPGVEPKLIMIGKGTTFKLNQMMDKSTLAPGLYGMNIVVRSKGTSRVMFEVSNDATPNQTTPEKTLNLVFAAAKSGNLASLKALVPASGDLDGDVRNIRDVAEAPEAAQAEFKEWFATGKIEGEPRIEGNKADVDFTFGPKGQRSETMSLTLREGKWYLDSF